MGLTRPATTFNRWAKAGVWLRVFEALAQRAPQSLQLIDSSIIRAHQHAAGGKNGGEDNAIGLSRGGLSTKIHAVVDHEGLPVRIVLTAGQAHDQSAVPSLLSDLAPGRDVVADRGYDSDAVLNLIRRAGAKPHIPSLSRRLVRRSVDHAIYRTAQPRRALLQQAEALQAHRNPLRQAGRELSGRRPSRLDAPMASVLRVQEPS